MTPTVNPDIANTHGNGKSFSLSVNVDLQSQQMYGNEPDWAPRECSLQCARSPCGVVHFERVPRNLNVICRHHGHHGPHHRPGGHPGHHGHRHPHGHGHPHEGSAKNGRHASPTSHAPDPMGAGVVAEPVVTGVPVVSPTIVINPYSETMRPGVISLRLHM